MRQSIRRAVERGHRTIGDALYCGRVSATFARDGTSLYLPMTAAVFSCGVLLPVEYGVPSLLAGVGGYLYARKYQRSLAVRRYAIPLSIAAVCAGESSLFRSWTMPKSVVETLECMYFTPEFLMTYASVASYSFAFMIFVQSGISSYAMRRPLDNEQRYMPLVPLAAVSSSVVLRLCKNGDYTTLLDFLPPVAGLAIFAWSAVYSTVYAYRKAARGEMRADSAHRHAAVAVACPILLAYEVAFPSSADVPDMYHLENHEKMTK